MKKKPSPLDNNGQIMAIAAHRYCLGRRSYIVGMAIEWLTLWWVDLNNSTKFVIVRDTVSALMRGEAGDECDTKEWKAFVRGCWLTIGEEDRMHVKNAVAYINKRFPKYLKISSRRVK